LQLPEPLQPYLRVGGPMVTADAMRGLHGRSRWIAEPPRKPWRDAVTSAAEEGARGAGGREGAS
jgi:hypothetical protein